MSTIPFNSDPIMTKYIVASGVFCDDPVTIVDVGARWGFNAEWQVFGESLKVLCFDPDAQECQRLNSSAGPNVVYVPAALGKEAGMATLHVTALGASSGLYKTNMDYFSRLLNGDNGAVVREQSVQLTTLDEALSRLGAPAVDFIKLDAEGAELDVLLGGARTLYGNSVIGLLSEFRFQKEINGCPTFTDLDSHVQSLGFRLYNMQFEHQSRRALPYPGVVDYRLPSGQRFFAYTTHGQIMDGDALYFRDLLIPANAAVQRRATATQVLKAASFFEIYGLVDCAAELILGSRDLLRPRVNCDELLDRLTPAIRGQKVGFTEYLEAYFDPNGGVIGE